jgi:hypothetical protein
MDDRPVKPLDDLPEKDRRQRVPLPSEWSNVMDELFEQALREGAFDNLPGKGKPLKLSKNPLNPEYELAFQLLKDNDYTLPWIAQRNEIVSRTDSLRADILHSWSRYHVEYQAARGDGIRMSLAAGWRDKILGWGDEIGRINKLIADTNLKQPGERLELFKLSLRRELERAGAQDSLE